MFEIATNEPGFDRDEDVTHLGKALKGPAQHSYHGAARFFRRKAEGVYDMDDLRQRTAKMTAFIRAHNGGNRPRERAGYPEFRAGPPGPDPAGTRRTTRYPCTTGHSASA